jgi:hypothetical protein
MPALSQGDEREEELRDCEQRELEGAECAEQHSGERAPVAELDDSADQLSQPAEHQRHAEHDRLHEGLIQFALTMLSMNVVTANAASERGRVTPFGRLPAVIARALTLSDVACEGGGRHVDTSLLD